MNKLVMWKVFAAVFLMIAIPNLALFAFRGRIQMMNSRQALLFLPFIFAYLLFVSASILWLVRALSATPGQAGVAVSTTETQRRIVDTFQTPNNQRPLIQVTNQGPTTLLTWTADLNAFQGTNLSDQKEKRVYKLRFDEKARTVYLHSRSVSLAGNASLGGFFGRLRSFQGVEFEASTLKKPALEMHNGRLQTDVKTIRFSSNDLLGPLTRILTEAGWTQRWEITDARWPEGLAVLLGLLALGIGAWQWVNYQ